jgi:DNA replication protein DnaD
MDQYIDIIGDLFLAFAIELSKHTLSEHMEPSEIIELIAKTKANIPTDINAARAKTLLNLYYHPVEDTKDKKIHTKNGKWCKPTKQHKMFYTNGVFFGPQADKKLIDWLAKQIEK